MPFHPEYFEKLGDIVRDYLSQFPCGNVTVRLRAYGNEYRLYKLFYKDDAVIGFLHHEERKEAELPRRADEPKALPAIMLPYECIESVELDNV
jgi:hypothetical protein